MHQASTYLNGEFGVGASFTPFTASQAQSLRQALRDDARSYLYSGAVSLAEAVNGADGYAFSWSTVKAYYATFYALRALLAIEGWAILYRGTKPFVAEAQTGSVVSKTKGNTHEVVLELFATKFPSHPLLSQEIASENPLEWIKHRREEANYTRARFVDPEIPQHFREIKRLGVRRALGAYVRDSYYAFDADHAILAFPLATLYTSLNRLQVVTGTHLIPDDVRFICHLCRDKDGPLTPFSSIFGRQLP
ncbi:hypothetical protein [Paraburkholderia sp. UCT2]|uniref:hypothetical protein n=1 Tax=Paraburkholderia sp. UCT2 TaxID=2615208 RepID=UPI001656361A|nr:hypothetical protein [Paraburkholderia sp. UCT2]MBC8729426.1 hypothetical protein [Paraburkholderia sp. UCT2]